MKEIKFICNLCRTKTEAAIGIHFTGCAPAHDIQPVQPMSAENHLCKYCVLALDAEMPKLKKCFEANPAP